MDALYQEKILAFAKATRGQTPLPAPTHAALVSNPTCGDQVDLKLQIEHDVILDASAEIVAVHYAKLAQACFCPFRKPCRCHS